MSIALGESIYVILAILLGPLGVCVGGGAHMGQLCSSYLNIIYYLDAVKEKI